MARFKIELRDTSAHDENNISASYQFTLPTFAGLDTIWMYGLGVLFSHEWVYDNHAEVALYEKWGDEWQLMKKK